MRSKIVITLIVIALIVVGAIWKSHKVNAPAQQPSKPEAEVVVTTPGPNQIITSPIKITGKAKGNWFFEASFPIKLRDSNGKILAVGTAKAQGDWQTADYVEFSASLIFKTPTTTEGSLEFSKDNPSGLPEFEKSFFLPVKFNLQAMRQPDGTCAPDSTACSGDAKLCMEENKAPVCN